MRNPIDVLNILSEKARDTAYKFERLYRNLYNPEFYLLAYKNIYANEGSMTPGMDKITVDGMSLKRIERVITSIKNRSFRPKPARREYIAKKNSSKKRPLGIMSGDDKLVQEVVRMMLESIYEPTFSDASHGFRPQRSCHTALSRVQSRFTGAIWLIEGDIESCFDSIDHQALVGILRRRIKDESFIALMWKFLKAGYMEQWQYHKTYTGCPQGSGISPILANIYMHELDSFMEGYASGFATGTTCRSTNPDYGRAQTRMRAYHRSNAKVWSGLDVDDRKRRAATLRKMKLEIRSLPARPIKDVTFKRLQYVRYADDFLIGIIGSKEDAEKIKSDIASFLKDRLALTLSPSKTLVTHTSRTARFLGYDVTVSQSQDTKRNKNGVKSRLYKGVVKLLVPHEKWAGKLLDCGAINIRKNEHGEERWKVMHRTKFFNLEDIDILSRINAEVRGLYNFYSLANNAYLIGRFSSVMKYSMMKTYAAKYRTTVSKIKQRYVVNGDFTVKYTTQSGNKESVYYNKGFKRQIRPMTGQIDVLDMYKKYARPSSVVRSLRAKTCELCNAFCEDIEIHQVKRLKELTDGTEWERLMKKRHRKTLAVCPKCHNGIHAC